MQRSDSPDMLISPSKYGTNVFRSKGSRYIDEWFVMWVVTSNRKQDYVGITGVSTGGKTQNGHFPPDSTEV